jgi:hypothetical protein
MSHYAVATTPCRPAASHGFTANSLAAKRFAENTTPMALSYNLVLPWITAFNGKLEGHIKELEASGKSDEDIVADMLAAGKSAGHKFALTSVRTALHTAIMCHLVSRGTPLSDSVVLVSDTQMRIHHEFYSRLLRAVFLPSKWAALVGPPATEGDVAFFETPGITLSAAFQDSVKRQAVWAVVEVVVATGEGAVNAALGAGDAPVAQQAVNAVRLGAMKLVCGATGAAIGSRWCPAADYWGETIGAVLSAFLLAKLLAGKKAAQNPTGPEAVLPQ